ncbi:MAG: hypothetical protein EPO31_10430 [Gammaproteobacteria bacterium]|nr:MAG: hypothetical protein EPO31_10430 [Gammaproteobacteria bacterium]
MIWTLYRMELFKLVKRLASWVTYLSYGVLIVMLYGSFYYNALKSKFAYFGFPNAWQAILELSAPVVSTFSAVLIVQAVASEFDWRTSRQNIIDGMSKRQWFTAKLLLLPTVAVFFFGSELIYSGTLAWLGTDPEIENAFAITSTQLHAIIGVFIGVLCYSSIALLVSLSVRSTGPALGITLIYQVFENITTRTLRGFDLDRLADWFPFQVHLALLKYNQYLTAGAEAKRGLEHVWDTNLLFVAGFGWIAVFLTASWLVYRNRDL